MSHDKYLSYPELQEFPLNTKLEDVIPKQAQRGLSTFDISFTCVDATCQYLAVGSNIGILYLHDRENNFLHKLRKKGLKSPVTSVKLHISNHCSVVFGCQNGTLVVFQVPYGSDKELRECLTIDKHKVPITALEWSLNGLKIFSGDENGLVISTDLELGSLTLLSENQKVVQLSYSPPYVLVSTVQRTLVYNTKHDSSTQVGKKERKFPGCFGAIFYNSEVFASRPSQRLWKSSTSGVIQETMLFKEALLQSHAVIRVQNQTALATGLENFQFGVLKLFDDRYLLAPSNSSLVVIDPENRSVIASCQTLHPLVDVATSGTEIFVIKDSRKLIRIATKPDIYCMDSVHKKEPSLLEEILVPFKELGSVVKSRAESLQESNSNTIFSWLKKRSLTSPVNIDKNETKHEDLLPGIVKIQSTDMTPIRIAAESLDNSGDPKKLNVSFKATETDDIVFKPKKKKGKGNLHDVSMADLTSAHSKAQGSRIDTAKDLDGKFQNVLSMYSQLKHGENSSDSHTDLESYEEVHKHLLNPVDNLNANDFETEVEINDIFPYTNHEMAEINDIEMDIIDSADSSIGDDIDAYPKEDRLQDSCELNGNDCPKYGVHWAQYKAPQILLHIAVSDKHIFCVDVKNKIYVADFPVLGLEWKKLDQPAEMVAVSPSENFIWALYRGTIFSAALSGRNQWDAIEWVSVAQDVVSLAVDDNCGWYWTSHKKLTTQQLVTSTGFGYPQDVSCPLLVADLACRNGVVWVLTTGGQLHCNKAKNRWKEIRHLEISSITSIALGYQETGWIVDTLGDIWFVVGITAETPEGIGKPWKVEASSYLFRSLTPHCTNFLTPSDVLGSFSKNNEVHVASSNGGVWFCNTLDDLIYCNQKRAIGHFWEVTVPPCTASTTKWNLLTAEGFCPSWEVMWCTSSTGELFSLCGPHQHPLSVDLPSPCSIQCLAAGPQSVWLLTKDGALYSRKGIAPNCLQGVVWQELDLQQLNIEKSKLIHISCSADTLWACSSEGKVFVWSGLSDSSSTWVRMEDEDNHLPNLKKIPGFECLPFFIGRHRICSVVVGPQSFMVWALDSKGNVYAREGISEDSKVGDKWSSVPGLQGDRLCVSRLAVWLVSPEKRIFRRFGISEQNLCGDYWKEVPGQMDKLSVTPSDELWGLKDNTMYKHASHTLEFSKQSREPAEFLPDEDDWECLARV